MEAGTAQPSSACEAHFSVCQGRVFMETGVGKGAGLGTDGPLWSWAAESQCGMARAASTANTVAVTAAAAGVAPCSSTFPVSPVPSYLRMPVRGGGDIDSDHTKG